MFLSSRILIIIQLRNQNVCLSEYLLCIKHGVKFILGFFLGMMISVSLILRSKNHRVLLANFFKEICKRQIHKQI